MAARKLGHQLRGRRSADLMAAVGVLPHDGRFPLGSPAQVFGCAEANDTAAAQDRHPVG